MQKGDLISIEFTGKDATSGRVFDTTNKETAQKEGLYSENKAYGPTIIVVGIGEVLKGLDEELLKMKVGEEHALTLEPTQAFGERSTELIKVIAISEFKKNNVSPVPGTIVNANDMIGKVQSVSGGRVRVDFNPDLAGKKVEYSLKIVKQFTDEKEQLNAITEKAFPGKEKPTISKNGEKIEVSASVRGMAPYQRNIPGFVKMALDTIKSVKKVAVTTEFQKEDFERMHVHADGQMHENDAEHVHE